jgi:hypothetical protein
MQLFCSQGGPCGNKFRSTQNKTEQNKLNENETTQAGKGAGWSKHRSVLSYIAYLYF